MWIQEEICQAYYYHCLHCQSPCHHHHHHHHHWQNPPGNWVILILSGQKPCTRIIKFKEYCILFYIFPGLKMLFIICNNTQENFSWECKKMNVKFHKNCENKIKFWKFHVKNVILLTLTFIFSGSHKKFSLVLLQMTNYIFSPWKMQKGMQYTLNYSRTRFLSIEN